MSTTLLIFLFLTIACTFIVNILIWNMYDNTMKKHNQPYPIELSVQETRWIKLIKGHYKSEYPLTSNTEWTDILKPMFEEIYGWSPDDHYNDYLNCIFNKLLLIYITINDQSSPNALYTVFNASFYKSITRTQDQPIERAISELCGLIQCTIVVEKDGTKRFDLNIK